MLMVSKSGYYDWLKRSESTHAKEDRRLVELIGALHTNSREAYGVLRCWHALRAMGETCGRHRVARLRRLHGIYAKRVRLHRYRQQPRQAQSLSVAANTVAQRFNPTTANTLWCSDISYLPTRRGWLYLAVVLDLYSRRVIGWSMGLKPTEKLALDALSMALGQRQVRRGLVHHSDQGVQYRGKNYQSLLAQCDIDISMSRKGNPHDNAVVESFFSSMKNELTHHVSFTDINVAKSAIFDYIEVFYNRQRLHSTLGYTSPVQYERMQYVA